MPKRFFQILDLNRFVASFIESRLKAVPPQLSNFAQVLNPRPPHERREVDGLPRRTRKWQRAANIDVSFAPESHFKYALFVHAQDQTTAQEERVRIFVVAFCLTATLFLPKKGIFLQFEDERHDALGRVLKIADETRQPVGMLARPCRVVLKEVTMQVGHQIGNL